MPTQPLDGYPIVKPLKIERAMRARDVSMFSEGQLAQAFDDKNAHGATLMHFAAEHGHLDLVPAFMLTRSRMLGDGAKLPGMKTPVTPLRVAARAGHLNQIPKKKLEYIFEENSTESHLALAQAALGKFPHHVPPKVMRACTPGAEKFSGKKLVNAFVKFIRDDAEKAVREISARN